MKAMLPIDECVKLRIDNMFSGNSNVIRISR